ncbi:uncharacterized protein LOC114787281 [Denticeps clupeoides]|uniref:uncharacterized protein LOC114787281 n=1 Tax=Denticeps clupeoides TaxID=299321 RepID=UPI0010A3F1B4|nr:uncharacterized protein LOC114787281 [Denticeps clupeoides]
MIFEQSGSSAGYIATALATSNQTGYSATSFVCANNNGKTRLFLAVLNNGALLTQNNTSSFGDFSGSVVDSTIRCIFTVKTISSLVRATTPNYYVTLFTGNYTNGVLGTPTIKMTSNQALDLSNPNSTNSGVSSTYSATSSQFVHQDYPGSCCLIGSSGYKPTARLRGPTNSWGGYNQHSQSHYLIWAHLRCRAWSTITVANQGSTPTIWYPSGHLVHIRTIVARPPLFQDRPAPSREIALPLNGLHRATSV